MAEGGAHVDDEGGQAVGARPGLLARGGAGEQQHQVGMFRAAGPDFLAVDDVVSPSLRAKVRSEVVSVPLVGSVTPNACRRSSPVAIFGR